jgi:hypothetical protein
MDPKIIQEISEAVARELRSKERASVVLNIDKLRVKGIGISTGFLTPYEVSKMLSFGDHPDPFYDVWAKALSLYTAKHLCGPAVPGVPLTKDRAPLCQFEDVPSDACEYNCGPILVLRTDIGEHPAPPCHGADKPACAGKVLFQDLCTMIKAAGCRPIGDTSYAYYYSVSVLDFSNRAYRIYEVSLMVDDLPLAAYSFGDSPESKAYNEILYLYMVIAFPYNFTAGQPPPGAE